MKIKSVEKEERGDIDNFLVTFDNGVVIGVEAKDEAEAKEKAKETVTSKEFYALTAGASKSK